MSVGLDNCKKLFALCLGTLIFCQGNSGVPSSERRQFLLEIHLFSRPTTGNQHQYRIKSLMGQIFYITAHDGPILGRYLWIKSPYLKQCLPRYQHEFKQEAGTRRSSRSGLVDLTPYMGHVSSCWLFLHAKP